MPFLDLLAESPALFISICALFGLIVGSFLNVVIYRLPIMLDRQWRQQCEELSGCEVPASTERFNLLVPRSACPSCKTPITAVQNIPILSYVLLKGRCRSCGAKISIRYPLVEALTAVLTGLVAWKFGFGWPALTAIVLTWFLIALTFIDIDHQLLPDNLTLPLMWIGLLLSLWGPAPDGSPIPVDMRSSIIGAAAGYMSLWSVYHLFRLITGKEGMGYGDFKLLGALGAWLGWKMLLPIILMAAGVGAVVGILALVLKRQERGTPIPFGPFLAAAGWLVLMFGREVVDGYLGLFSTGL